VRNRLTIENRPNDEHLLVLSLLSEQSKTSGTTVSLLETIVALNNSCDGVGLAGHINVETGSIEVSTGLMPGRCEACIQHLGFSRNCAECGRKKDTHYSFPSGAGDGVYAGISFYSQQGTTVLGSLWLFDDSNKIATATSAINSLEALSRDIVGDLVLPHLGDFKEIPGLVLGELDLEAANELLAVQDENWEPLDDAVMLVPFSSCDRYTVALFFQPVVDSAPAKVYRAAGGDETNMTGGFPESLYPRALVIVDSTRADELLNLGNNESLISHDWSRQFSAWNTALQYSNVNPNGAQCALFNGRLWNAVLERQKAFDQNQRAIPELNENYFIDAFGWTLQASLNGLTEADALLSSLYEDHRESLDDETLAEICRIRGFQYSGLEKFLAEVTRNAPKKGLNTLLSKPAPKYCPQCGNSFSESAKFCQECGSARAL